MTTTAHRTSVFRSFPALLALVLAFFAATATPAVTAPDVHRASISASLAQHIDTASAAASAPASAVPAEATAPPAEPVSGYPVADRTRVLLAQRSTGTAGSRAPPRTAA
ncbi:hypothetical protein [Actinoplanes awajinensis]|uniref:Secreted protein n=1 Tax=Actinoplanes awajinensis subsp. mycoplanecinus TaxID=135947 RepID=A0A101JD13_9ACTN|nr:hypothetical protein [Actinoplanes awajinensis]KUL24525.1 hypothetical protein ADL15_43385 [Actinoplanes awajinensis subsp. mycoplanecinus]